MAPFAHFAAPIDPLLRPDPGSSDLDVCETRQLLNPVIGEMRIGSAFGGGPSSGPAEADWALTIRVSEAA